VAESRAVLDAKFLSSRLHDALGLRITFDLAGERAHRLLRIVFPPPVPVGVMGLLELAPALDIALRPQAGILAHPALVIDRRRQRGPVFVPVGREPGVAVKRAAQVLPDPPVGRVEPFARLLQRECLVRQDGQSCRPHPLRVSEGARVALHGLLQPSRLLPRCRSRPALLLADPEAGGGAAALGLGLPLGTVPDPFLTAISATPQLETREHAPLRRLSLESPFGVCRSFMRRSDSHCKVNSVRSMRPNARSARDRALFVPAAASLRRMVEGATG
jgi:hypothetical protein